MPNTFDIATLGQGAAAQAASGLLGGIFGLMTEKHNDARQIRQQQALTDMQQKANQEQAKYTNDLQYEQWLRTNYPAQIEQMTKAGLNPGLLYGMSGGGGQTTGSASAAGVAGSNAPSGGGEIMGQMQMGLQAQLIAAQTENIKADTANKQAENPNIPKTGANIDADTQKKLQDTAFSKVMTDINKIELKIKADTQEDQTRIIQEQAHQAIQTTDILENQGIITWEEAKRADQMAHEKLINLQLQNDVNRKQLKLTDAQINQISQSIAQKWAEIQIGQKNATTNQKQQDLQKFIHDMPDSSMLIGKSISNILGIIGLAATR